MAGRRFRFRLQKVLDYRETIERRVQSELAALESERMRKADEQRRLEIRREETLMRLVELQAGELDPLEDALQRSFARGLDAEISRVCAEIRALDRRVDDKRAELVQATKDRKVMQQLKEDAWREFRAEELRAEQTTLDEIGGQMFVRQAIEAERSGEGVLG
jgi:flagellar FliJ protein